MARAGENTIDAQVKQAKAQVEMAKARKLGSEADKLDLDFLLKDSGYAAPSAALGTKWDTSEIRPRNIAMMYCIKY